MRNNPNSCLNRLKTHDRAAFSYSHLLVYQHHNSFVLLARESW